MAKDKRTKGQTTIYKALHKKLRSRDRKFTKKGVNSCAPER